MREIINTSPIKDHQSTANQRSKIANHQSLLEVLRVFLRLGLTAFGGPAAHVALMERACVRERQWVTRQQFLDLLGVANLIPGPTSTELAMHIGRHRAGWPGLIVAGLAFILPSAIVVGLLAAAYRSSQELPLLRGILDAVQPVVLIVVFDALVPLARTAMGTGRTMAIAVLSVVLALAGVPDLAILVLGGLASLGTSRLGTTAVLALTASSVLLASATNPPGTWEVFTYFAGIGSLLFGSGYVLLPILEGDLVTARGWLTGQQLLDAVAAGQATPGPVFTTATFIGYIIGGPAVAAAATIGIFLPAFICSALASTLLSRIGRSAKAQHFLSGVNASAVALIALVLVALSRTALTGADGYVIAAVSAVLLFGFRVGSSWLLLGAAILGAAMEASAGWRMLILDL